MRLVLSGQVRSLFSFVRLMYFLQPRLIHVCFVELRLSANTPSWTGFASHVVRSLDPCPDPKTVCWMFIHGRGLAARDFATSHLQ